MGISQSGLGRSPKPASNGAVVFAIILAVAALLWAASHAESVPEPARPTPATTARP